MTSIKNTFSIQIVVFLLAILASFQLNSQVNGATTVNANSTHTYQLNNGIAYPFVDWIIHGGTKISTSRSGRTYYVTVTWGSGIFGSVIFTASNHFIDVTINSTTPSTPSTPTIQSSNCGNAVLARGTPPSGVTWYWQGKVSNGTSTTKGNGSTFTANEGSGTYYIRARNSNGVWSTNSGSKYVSIDPIPSFASGSGSSRCNTGTVRLTASSGANGTTIRWYSSSAGGSVLHTGTFYTTPSISSTATYYVASYNSSTGCQDTDRRAITATVNPVPVWYADTDGDGYGNSGVTTSACTQPSGYVSNNSDYDDSTVNITNIAPQYFYDDSDGDGFGNPVISLFYSVIPSGYVANNNDQCPNEAGSFNGCDYTPVTFSDENYIYTRVYQERMSSDSEINQDSDIIESITYFDGLGRPMQSIGIKAAPNKKDIITHIDYDAYGRQDKDWLPYHEATGNLGSYRGDKALTTQEYYQSNYAEDFVGITNAQDIIAYSQKDFEASPLNRVLEQAAPGEDWKLGGGHGIAFDYQTNIAIEVKNYGVDLSAATPVLTISTLNSGNYDANELYKTITYDENYDSNISLTAHTTEEFKGKQGRVILKRTYGTSIVNGVSQTNTAHDTYYVYDDYSNLTYVLPPKMEAGDASTTLTTINNQLDDLGYQYIYDDRNRLVEKKIPGKDWEYIVYNNLDQPVLTQDAQQRPNKQWLFTKYDVFGRVTYTGIYTHGTVATRPQMVTALKTYYATNPSEDLFEEKVGTEGSYHYYSNGAFPNTGLEVLTVNYYDNYSFDMATLSLPEDVLNNNNTSQELTKGLATGSKVRVLGTTNWITTITGYDVKGRPVYVASNNSYLVTIDIIKSTLNFAGAVVKTETNHTKGGNNVITEDLFTYDHVGRLKKQTQELGNTNVLEVIVENNYDKLGQLERKDVGGKTTQGRLQNVDYTYNVRGWLKQINNPTTLGNDLFGFKIGYNEGANALYNGNISLTQWKTANTDTSLKIYDYQYDALNRITIATGNTSNYNLNSVAYDKNGNITSLERRGHINSGATSFGVMDDLTYSYDSGNKLMKVADAAPIDQFGFKDDAVNTTADTTNDYTYDANGNMLTDANKGISTNISYNHLNLPEQVTLSAGNISYIYDATGVKLQKKVVESGKPDVYTYYAGNYVYENSSLKFFNHPEGYVEPKDENNLSLGYNYVYQYKDHLGNVRLSYQDTNGNYEQILDSDFESSFDGWEENGSVNYTLNNGRLKANVKSSWEGIRHPLTEVTTVAGETLTVKVYFDKGNTQSSVRLYLPEYNSSGTLVSYNVLTSNLQTGYSEHTLTMLNSGNSIGYIRIDKDNTNTGIETYFYIDQVSLIQNDLEILEENNYYPFGLKHKGYNTNISANINSVAKKFKYNGVEYEDALGLNLYEMDVRSYDPAIGRFTSIDPITHYSQSTYTAFDNNPIFWADPSGADSESEMAFTDWYRNDKGDIVFDPKINNQEDLDNAGIDGEYIAEKFVGKDQNGAIFYFNEDGSITQSEASEEMFKAAGLDTSFLIDVVSSVDEEGSEVQLAGADATALAAMAFMATDGAIPDWSDVAWPKWASYAIIAAGATYLLNQSKATLNFSKTARGNQRDTGLQGVTDAEIATELSALTGSLTKAQKAQKRRLQKEQKARGQRNKQKKSSEKGTGTGRQ